MSVNRFPVSVAPMMDWTDRHCRYFLRQLAPRVRLYTEMITTAALIHGARERLLAYDRQEHPLAIQLGGSEPQELAFCAALAQAAGYDEVNLNVGCPSDRVQSGRFGACLMLEPARVADCVRAMREAVTVPVTVKCRIGVDQRDSYAELAEFVAGLLDAGLRHLVVHARKAWLQGLSPRQNRDIPPLRYEQVYRLKLDFPTLEVTLNGGIADVPAIARHLRQVDGVMLGRAAYHDPWLLVAAQSLFEAPGAPRRSRAQVVAAMLPYVEAQLQRGTRLQQITRHMLDLFQGLPGARAWRRYLSENAHRDTAGPEVLRQALARVPAETGAAATRTLAG